MSVRTYKVYVGNLGDNGRKEEIEREFEKFGRLHDVWVACTPQVLLLLNLKTSGMQRMP